MKKTSQTTPTEPDGGPQVVSAEESEKPLLVGLSNWIRTDLGQVFIRFGGDEYLLTGALLDVVQCAAEGLGAGRLIQVQTLDQEITSQQAARLLGVSRTYLLGLVDSGRIRGAHTVGDGPGAHRRISLQGVAEYRRDRERRAAARQGEEEGDD